MKTATPKKPLSNWPPLQYDSAHRVTNGESWVTLAKKYGRNDPWDIIQFNFETKTPEEVNYYLAHRIGCTRSTDGINYSFSSSDEPGLVYIPPAEWTPSMGPYKDKYKDQVIRTLDNWAVERAPFINRSGVVDLIRKNIAVVEYKTLWVPYEYDFVDTLFCRSLNQDFPDQAWLVKEAVHIWHGVHGWNDGGYLQNEVDGWVALAAWFDLQMGPGLQNYFQFLYCTEGHPHKMKTFSVARDYWLQYKENRKPLAPSTAELEKVVRRDPSFMRRSHTYRRNRAWHKAS